LLAATGHSVGVYSSPHLLLYNERIRIAGQDVSDDDLIAAFEAIEAARADIPLTFFEYGTLAAFILFSRADCDVWVLEVGLGGRLDAVNVIDPDYAVVTTVDLDHQDWLGETIEEIAAEKAGVARPDRPLFYGDVSPPQSLRDVAADIGAELINLGNGYSCQLETGAGWSWQGENLRFSELPLPAGSGVEQIRNMALALAVIERFDPAVLAVSPHEILAAVRLPGRFQIVTGTHQWVLDVAHNPQAAHALAEKVQALPATSSTTIVVGMLADKQAKNFVAELGELADRWITCTTTGERGYDALSLADCLPASAIPVESGGTVPEALARARACTPAGGRIIVCGSFMVVGPALEWLGLYCAGYGE
jgi:dihydrofolate synthase/folylpolyglutamate synthase